MAEILPQSNLNLTINYGSEFNQSKYFHYQLHADFIFIGGITLMNYMGAQRTKGMKKLAKLKQMDDVYQKQKDLINIRKKKGIKKTTKFH